MTIAFLQTWQAAKIPPADILRAITINGYKAADIIKERGPIKPGFFADVINAIGVPAVAERLTAAVEAELMAVGA